MKSELEGAIHPDKGSTERAFPGANRRFDGMEATMKLGFCKLDERLREEGECHRENSEDGQRAAQHWRLDVAVQLTEVAMKICRDGRGGSGNGDRFATVIDGGGSELEDGGGGVGHDIKSRKPQSVRVMYNEFFGL